MAADTGKPDEPEVRGEEEVTPNAQQHDDRAVSGLHETGAAEPYCEGCGGPHRPLRIVIR